MVTYGQYKYSRMAMKYLYQNTKEKFYFFGIIGKPNDLDNKLLFKAYNADYIEHGENKGFPYSLNDIYEHLFINKQCDNVVIIGNDVLVYPNVIDYLLEYSDNYDYVSGQEIDIDFIKKNVKGTNKKFGYGKKFIGDDFPEFMEYKSPITERTYDITKYKIIGDTHNMTLFTKRWFGTVGYVDVNFYPAYFEDNDYARRGQLLGMKMVQLQKAKYFHFWSRTIKEDEEKRRENDFYFPKNEKYYITKWGGKPGEERYTTPYNGRYYPLGNILLPPSLSLHDRSKEDRIVSYWKSLWNS